jgi:hypothetical protein
VLIGRAGLFIRSANSVGRAVIDIGHLFIGVLNLLAVLGGLVAYLINFGLNGSRSVVHVFFRGASGGEQNTRYDACCGKKNSHGQKNLGVNNAIRTPDGKSRDFNKTGGGDRRIVM